MSRFVIDDDANYRKKTSLPVGQGSFFSIVVRTGLHCLVFPFALIVLVSSGSTAHPLK